MPDIGFKLPGGKKSDIPDCPTNGQVLTFNSCKDLWDAQTNPGGGEANTSSNAGCGDGWALAKCGVDLPFKSVITTSPLATSVNANDLTFTIDNISFTLLADGTDGELITWDACGVPAAVAVGTACQVLTSNGVGAAPTFQAAGGGGGFSTVFKTSDETITCDTTLSDDADITFCADANSNYAVITYFRFNTCSVPDYKTAFSVPACATMKNSQSSAYPALGIDVVEVEATSSVSLLVSGGGDDHTHGLTNYVLETGGTSGAVAYQWAQNTSSAGPTKFLKGSWLAFKKLS